MFWNHRIVRTVEPIVRAGEEVETLFAVMEVHYNDDNSLMAYTEPFLHSETLEGLTETHARMTAALALPVLDAADFPTYDDNEPVGWKFDAAGVETPLTVEDVVCIDRFDATGEEKAAAADMLAKVLASK
jgi:hypothetical protein